jgi:hypothetical protein
MIRPAETNWNVQQSARLERGRVSPEAEQCFGPEVIFKPEPLEAHTAAGQLAAKYTS